MNLLTDFKFAWRSLARVKGLAITVAATLALGIGANAAIFSLVNSVLLRPLPVKDAGRLVLVTDGAAPGIRTYSYAVWDQLNQRPELFDLPLQLLQGAVVDEHVVDEAGLLLVGHLPR